MQIHFTSTTEYIYIMLPVPIRKENEGAEYKVIPATGTVNGELYL